MDADYTSKIIGSLSVSAALNYWCGESYRW